MVVLGQFFQVTERPVTEVSVFWKAAHTSTCIILAISGILTAFTFGTALENFSYNCILDAHLKFENSTYLNASFHGKYEKVKLIDLSSSQWGTRGDCNFAQFTPLVSMICAVIWGSYFLILSRGGAGLLTDLLSKSWTIVYPCIIFTIIFFIVYVISTLKLKHGSENFCAEFKPIFNNTGCVEQIDIYSKQFYEEDRGRFYDFYKNMLTASTFAQIGIWSWVIQLVLCLVRIACFVDFEVQLVTVSTKEEEKVEKVVELAAPRYTDDETSEV